ncbi:MAG TPA: ABC transporter permease [Trueperaceae bacterium]|nr:ABC transporter permease [Trueperaceae bacterium]
MSRGRVRGDKARAIGMALPATFWLVVFFLLPLVFVAVASFMSRGPGGSAIAPATLAQYERTFTVFGPVLWRSIGVALLTTVVSLGLGYPLAFYISRRRSPSARMLLLFLVMLPFWTNFLVRTYALITIMQRDGLLNGLFQSLGLISAPLQMLFTPTAVVIGLVYGYLPFMILPIYASVEALDWRYVEAANDLGANDWTSFWRVIFPLTLPGVIAGCILVFIPAIGSYITPDLMGGTRGLMIGNLIQGQFGGRGNVPLGSAISMVLLAMVFISVLVYTRWGQREDA